MIAYGFEETLFLTLAAMPPMKGLPTPVHPQVQKQITLALYVWAGFLRCPWESLQWTRSGVEIWDTFQGKPVKRNEEVWQKYQSILGLCEQRHLP